ncbi:MAG TPA: hypothetical protein DDZ80_12545 [Cyanobacteria bacterium UBA8803]|nr:hypothetical protein [Cyanobacteria bacterium UBA9273]HBL59307.1 hypothetical protein [Cyanobacteria bacterium UBA8803]
MCITGALSDFSLPEICRLLAKGHQTGLLTLHTDVPTPATPQGVCYIWMYLGRIVAVTHQLNHQGLLKLMGQCYWFMDAQGDNCASCLLAKLVRLYPSSQPLGLFLKDKGVLTTNQLKDLFQVQVLQPMCTLFELKAGRFKFDHNVPAPALEMTGLSISAATATLIGLRVLSNWDALADKLPAPDEGLLSLMTEPPHYPLSALERKVWQYTNGRVSLKAIAQQLELPVEKVQQVAFRLIAAGLAEEVPLFVEDPSLPVVETLSYQLDKEAETQKFGHPFLHNLRGFLAPKSDSSAWQAA